MRTTDVDRIETARRTLCRRQSRGSGRRALHASKVVRTMLLSIGVRHVHEAPDGPAGLELIRRVAPDVVILDWQMPGLDGPGFVRMVRSPATFPYPDVPIIMLTGHGERSRVIEAVKIGVNEFLLKPVSVKAL